MHVTSRLIQVPSLQHPHFPQYHPLPFSFGFFPDSRRLRGLSEARHPLWNTSIPFLEHAMLASLYERFHFIASLFAALDICPFSPFCTSFSLEEFFRNGNKLRSMLTKEIYKQLMGTTNGEIYTVFVNR